MGRTREKRSTKKSNKVVRKTIPLPKPSPLPKTPQPINPKLQNVKYQPPSKGKHRHAKKK